jgi:hypothetical protein
MQASMPGRVAPKGLIENRDGPNGAINCNAWMSQGRAIDCNRARLLQSIV